MQQALKTSLLKSLFGARREAKPACSLPTLDRDALRRVVGGAEAPPAAPKGGW